VPFQQLTSNQLIGHMSAQQLSLALNSFGVSFPSGADDTTSIGTVKVFQPLARARVIIRSDGVYGAAETVAYILRYQDAAGADVDQALVTASLSNVTGAGTFQVADIEINQIPVGSVLQLNRDYTAGTPNDPVTSITVELY